MFSELLLAVIYSYPSGLQCVRGCHDRVHKRHTFEYFKHYIDTVSVIVFVCVINNEPN